MLSIPHLIIIFVVALVVFGPEKLPELARNLGKVMAEFRRATGDLRSTFEDHLRDLERETDQRRIGGTNYQPPAPLPATGATQANVPAPIPTTAPNAPERLEAASYAPENSSAVEGANGSMAGVNQAGSSLPSEGPASSAEPEPANAAETDSESPHVTRP